MDVISDSAARANLSCTMDRVCDDHETVIITRQGGSPVVMMSLADYNSYEETAYLLSNPRNAAQLRKAIEQFEVGLGRERELIECD